MKPSNMFTSFVVVLGLVSFFILAAPYALAQVSISNDGVTFPDDTEQTSAVVVPMNCPHGDSIVWDENADSWVCETDLSAPPPSCTDGDSDGWGAAGTDQSGCASIGDDCNDNNATVNPGAPEICDGVDNDCDGAVDQSDVPVGVMCGAAPDNAIMYCLGAQGCVWECDSHWADCDGLEPNGCETNTNTVDNCGGCGQACPIDQGPVNCVSGVCVFN